MEGQRPQSEAGGGIIFTLTLLPLLCEDLQEGFTWNGTTVVYPFAPKRHAPLEAVLNG